MQQLSQERGVKLLRAKLYTPAINKNIVSRENLTAKLQYAKECKLTLVTAPAGYGKTTAVLDWLCKCALPHAWLSLDSQDNDPATFWRYVCTALDSITDGIIKDTEYVFSSQELMKANIHISRLLDILSEVQYDFLLVLDDLHLINDSSILKGLSYLIDYLPTNMHLVFISRTEPELDLSRHRIKWQAQRLEEEDLRFKNEEISLFYQARGYSLPEDDIKKVESYTEGWAAAMVAVAMSMENAGGSNNAIAALTRSNRDIEQYLKDEVISTWRPERQAFAIKTCILGTLSEALCDAVTEENNGGRMLREISEGSGFLVALDKDKQKYRYHYLFKNFLHKLLIEAAPDEIARLHEKAGLWYRKQSLLPEAIEHFLRGGAYREASELIEHQIDHLIHKNDFGRLLSWIELLPAEYRNNSFKSAVIYALYYAETGRYDLSRQWIEQMKTLKERYRFVSGSQQYSDYRRMCVLVESNLLVREGNAGFMPMLVSATEESRENTFKMPAYNDFNMADIYYYRCPINKSAKLFRETPAQFSSMVKSYRRIISINPGYAPLGIGEYYYENNSLEEAVPYLLKAIDEAQAAGCPGALVPAMVDIARIKRAKGDLQGAFEVLDQCENRLQSIGKAHWNYMLNAFRCRLLMDKAYNSGVEEWYTSCKLNIFAEINRIREFELIVYARVLMAKGYPHDAEILLHRLHSFTEESGRLHSMVEVLNLLALLACKSRDMADASEYLERSLKTGIAEGYVRSFMDERLPMMHLLKYYITSRKKTEQPDTKILRQYAKSLLDQMREALPTEPEAYGEAAVAGAGIKKPLTEQEKKVLELLAEANTNQEISTKLGISLRTVKTHTGNIYDKLGVKNRAQCVKLARDTALLE